MDRWASTEVLTLLPLRLRGGGGWKVWQAGPGRCVGGSIAVKELKQSNGTRLMLSARAADRGTRGQQTCTAQPGASPSRLIC